MIITHRHGQKYLDGVRGGASGLTEGQALSCHTGPESEERRGGRGSSNVQRGQSRLRLRL